MLLWRSLRSRIVVVAVVVVLGLSGALLAVLDSLLAEELERHERREASAALETLLAAAVDALRADDHPALERLVRRVLDTGRVEGVALFDRDHRLVAALPGAASAQREIGQWGGASDREVDTELHGVPVRASFHPVDEGGERLGGAWVAIDRRPAETALRRVRVFAAIVVLALVGVSMVIATLAAESLVRPLDELGETVAVLGRGELDARHPIAGTDEMRRLARRVNRMAEQLEASRASLSHVAADLDRQVRSRTSELEQANRRLAELAHTDPLTGLTNRRGLEIELERFLSLSRRSGHPLAVIMLDLDNFKRYNDACGHLAGDNVLRAVGAALLGRARAHDVVARWGGDEFCILAPGAEADGALIVAKRFVQSVVEAMRDLSRPDVSAALGASAGVACFPEDGEESIVLIARADAALYRVKNAGGAGVARLDGEPAAVEPS